jgi:hypothetical protein
LINLIANTFDFGFYYDGPERLPVNIGNYTYNCFGYFLPTEVIVDLRLTVEYIPNSMITYTRNNNLEEGKTGSTTNNECNVAVGYPYAQGISGSSRTLYDLNSISSLIKAVKMQIFLKGVGIELFFCWGKAYLYEKLYIVPVCTNSD